MMEKYEESKRAEDIFYLVLGSYLAQHADHLAEDFTPEEISVLTEMVESYNPKKTDIRQKRTVLSYSPVV